MAIRDLGAMNGSLDNDYGVNRGPNAADSHLLALFAGDPMLDGVELDGGGYARVPVAPEDWADAVNGAKSTALAVQFADATDAWADVATHWGLLDADDPAVMWDCAPLPEAVDVTAAGPGPAVQPTVYYAEIVTAAE